MRHRIRSLRCGLLLPQLILALGLAHASAQEPINADSATQPSPGHFTIKEQFRYYSLDLSSGQRDERSKIRDAVFLTTINAGLARDVSLSLRTPVDFRRRSYNFGGVDHDAGVGDVTTLVKWRFLRNDTNPLDTQRMSLLAGAEIRTGDDPFTNDAYNPLLGLAYTQIAGRHGLNANASWTFTTGGAPDPIYAGMSTADVFRYNGAYLFRLWPEAFTAETSHGAWYAMLEANGVYETDGDNELLLAPGLMYEAVTWALELSVQLPVWRDVEHRAETDYVLVAGVRFSF